MRLFTWHDVETIFKTRRDIWPESWNRIDVYNDEIVINVNSNNRTEENVRALKALFGKCYSDESIILEFNSSRLEIIYEEGSEKDKSQPAKTPLFKDLLINKANVEPLPDLPGSPIIAFHSYKGGVGRTLSLISLVREISDIYKEKKHLLIIDADLEAPGLTWMLDQETENRPISYLDVLSLMHFYTPDNELAQKTAALIETSRLVVETERLEVEQYFLPVYRGKNQIMNIFSTPEKIISVQDNKYVITEFLSMVGAALGADLILVDLRAGITEFSAPFLFDSRVQKYFISSTSMQSQKGLELILDEIHSQIGQGLLNSKILLTMIPDVMDERTIRSIEDRLAKNIDEEIDSSKSMFLRENYLVRIRFDNAYAHLGNFREICSLLKGKGLSTTMRQIAENLFEQEEDREKLSKEEIQDTLRSLKAIAEAEVTAEGNVASNMLSTSSIREIAGDFSNDIPKIVVCGAKGSGKTYIYKQLLFGKTWDNFVDIVDSQRRHTGECTLILPLISSVNIGNLHKLIQGCIQHTQLMLPEVKINSNAVNKNHKKLQSLINASLSSADWSEAWQSLMHSMLGDSFESLADADAYLEHKEKRLLFLVDGLEDLFVDDQLRDGENWKTSIRALCQDTINDIRNLPYGNIGIIVFVRKDMIEEAIPSNLEQFKNQYSRYELKWTPTEALRLALWISSKANPVFGEDINILKSTREALEERLELLWGKKLGKKDSREATSSRWIIAALSDFKGQLQARDIVRFLQYAAENTLDGELPYMDRYLMPSAIRKAISSCSTKKYSEIASEMKTTYQILQKFEQMDESDKILPLTLDKIRLRGDEISRLENQGFLSISEEKYYLPEIIRFALGFRYEKGARPKVLSLLSQ